MDSSSDWFRGLINGLVSRLGPRTVDGLVGTISVDGCVFRAVKGVAYGPVYGLVHSSVIVRVSRMVFGLVTGLWVGYLAHHSLFVWTHEETDEWTSVWSGEGAHAPLGD